MGSLSKSFFLSGFDNSQWYTWRIVTISSEEDDDGVEALSHLSSVDTDNDIGTSCT